MRDRAMFLTSVAALTALATAGAWAFAANQHEGALAWQQADLDHDGLPLLADLDPDSDGLPSLADPDADDNGSPNATDSVRAALAMQGELSDPLMGKYGNLLGRAGFVVCVDVVVNAWLRAGLSAPELLRVAAVEHPDWFALDAANTPGDPNFVRRVRNYRALFTHHPALVLDGRPHLGDWVFYGENHVALVTSIDGAGYTATEAYGPTVATIAGAKVERRTGERGVFGRPRVAAE